MLYYDNRTSCYRQKDIKLLLKLIVLILFIKGIGHYNKYNNNIL
jgi:hypothetical protein